MIRSEYARQKCDAFENRVAFGPIFRLSSELWSRKFPVLGGPSYTSADDHWSELYQYARRFCVKRTDYNTGSAKVMQGNEGLRLHF
jgi:hypothetical protein